MKVNFFPGLGADERLAKFHVLPGHDVEWVRWPRRIADTWDGFQRDLLEEYSIEEGAAFIGISFGGMSALKLAPRKRPRGVILLGSCRSSRAIAPSLRLFKPLVPCLPGFLFDVDLLPGLPIYSLRGSEDRMILAQREKRDAIVAGAGNLVSMTHPDTVNQRLLEWLRGLEAGPVRP